MNEVDEGMKHMKWVLMAVLFGLAFAGCYTMIAHPAIQSGDTTYQPRQQCSDCHSSADYYYYHYPYYYDSYWGHSYWRSYYMDPWWWHDYWYWEDSGEEGQGLPEGTPRYWDQRNRPAPTPKLVPGSGTEKSKEEQAPPASGSDTKVKEDTKKSQDTSGKQYWERPPKRPEKPPEPEQPKKEQEKEKEKE
jgi:hypothetical protein